MSIFGVEGLELAEWVLRIGCFGCFVGHGWIAAFKLEFSGWVKFMRAGGFTDEEAHIVMPLIGWMDVVLGVITLLSPSSVALAWMTAWAFSTALMRPVSGGLIWGWVERAGNWACPLALMVMGKDGGAWRMPALAPLEKYLSPNSILADDLLKLAFGFLVFTWSLVFVLRNRPALGAADADAGAAPAAAGAAPAAAAAAGSFSTREEEEFDEEKAAKMEDTLVPKALRYNSPGRKAASSIFVEGKRRRQSPARFVAKN